MDVSSWVWFTTVGLLVGVLAVDVFVIGRRPHEPSLRECAIAITFYIGLALLFGLAVLFTSGGRYAGEFYAGWLTEYSLSIDNLFVFVIIMARLAVPRPAAADRVARRRHPGSGHARHLHRARRRRHQGVQLGLLHLRRVPRRHRRAWLAMHKQDEADVKESALLRFIKRRLPASDGYHGVKLFVRENGRRLMTPMLVVIIALGTTDLLFALDSIPAIYGLTKEPYLVFAANVFALMGLRQLYFLIGGLLERLVYLNIGLSAVLAFIGVKLVLEALHGNELAFVNGGEHVAVPEIPIWLSLAVILGTLAVTTVASLVRSGRDREQADHPD